MAGELERAQARRSFRRKSAAAQGEREPTRRSAIGNEQDKPVLRIRRVQPVDASGILTERPRQDCEGLDHE